MAMKRLSLFLLFGFLLGACDIIDEPYLTTPGGDDGEPDDFEIENVVQKALLEEFTGHQCPNCPDGAATAEQLHNLYGEKFVIIAYHAGYFARTSSSFPADFRTEVGTELDNYFKPTGYPAGTINRTEQNGQKVYGNSIWPGATAEVIGNEPRLGLEMIPTLSSGKLNVTVRAQAFNELPTLQVSVFITEDGIISPQKTTSETIEDYEHNHMFRMSLNGTWGSPIFADGAVNGSKQSFKVSGTLKTEWKTDKLTIVCFAYNPETDEIVQVEAVKL